MLTAQPIRAACFSVMMAPITHFGGRKNRIAFVGGETAVLSHPTPKLYRYSGLTVREENGRLAQRYAIIGINRSSCNVSG